MFSNILIFIFLQCTYSYVASSNEWMGKWFPGKPGEPDLNLNTAGDDNSMSWHGISPSCDDGQTGLDVDYNERNMSHHVVHICLKDRSLFRPNINTPPVMTEFVIPVEYRAIHRCMNESIEYDDYRIPTFGNHRHIWAAYGEYKYLPPQRWLHNVEHGAIAMLYHPCADINQIDKLKNIVKKCLYRHVITAYDRLEAKTPFALVAYGKSLELSVIDENIVIGFIRMNALHGLEKLSINGIYNSTLTHAADYVTSVEDDLLCPNM